MIPTIDHKALAISRLITQYSEADQFLSYVSALVAEGDNVEMALQQILNERWIDTAYGAQLDILGEIVGQPRYIIDGAFAKFFGFFGNPNATGFGVDDFWDHAEPNVITGYLEDEAYRQYIKARVVTNHAEGGTHEDYVLVFKTLFGSNTAVLTKEMGNAKLQVFIGAEVTSEDRLLISSSEKNHTLPRAAGVGVEYFEFAGVGPFGFAPNPLAVGFGAGGFYHSIGVA